MSELASERMYDAMERAIESSSAEQTNERAVRVNEHADERMARYSTSFFPMWSGRDLKQDMTTEETEIWKEHLWNRCGK